MFTQLFRILLILLLIPISMACSLFTSIPKPGQEDIEKEEQAVYAALVSKSSGLVLILENTSTGLPTDDPKQASDNLKSSFPKLSKEALNSFMERNKSTDSVSPNMQLGVDYVLLSEKELAKISSQPNWNEVLAKEYPGSQGYLIFSRVGFNQSLDHAIVYMGEVAGPLMGAGYYYLLEKQDGKWIVKNQVMAWIS